MKLELRGFATACLLGFMGMLLMITVPRGLPGIELLQTLRFHIAILGLPLAVVLWICNGRWRSVFTVLLTFASIGEGLLPIVEGYHRRAQVSGTEQASLTVLSFNVLASNSTPQAAVDYIMASGADAVVIMETPGIEAHLDELAAVYPHRVGCQSSATCDLSILSRTPIANGRMGRPLPFRFERFGAATIEIDGQTVTIVGAHLSKPYFDEAAWSELLQLSGWIGTIEGPVVVAGDFNAAAWSYDVAAMAQRADLVPSPNHPATWPVPFGPFGVPIDNMFTRSSALIETLEALPNAFGSNHRALLATISLR